MIRTVERALLCCRWESATLVTFRLCLQVHWLADRGEKGTTKQNKMGEANWTDTTWTWKLVLNFWCEKSRAWKVTVQSSGGHKNLHQPNVEVLCSWCEPSQLALSSPPIIQGGTFWVCVFTVRNSRFGKVMFSQARVRNSVNSGVRGGGVSASGSGGCTPPRQTSPPRQTPPPRWPLQRTLRILLECILVFKKIVCLCTFRLISIHQFQLLSFATHTQFNWEIVHSHETYYYSAACTIPLSGHDKEVPLYLSVRSYCCILDHPFHTTMSQDWNRSRVKQHIQWKKHYYF